MVNWDREHFTLWRIREKARQSFQYTEITKVELQGFGPCPFRMAMIDLLGLLPMERELFFFQEDDVLELHHCHFGSKSDYNPENTMFRLAVKSVMGPVVEKLNPFDVKHGGHVTAALYLGGNIEIMDNWADWYIDGR